MSILSDKRPIESVCMSDDSGWQVGRSDITKIVPYAEPGQGAFVPWLEIWRGDHLIVRVNAATVSSVHYRKDP